MHKYQARYFPFKAKQLRFAFILWRTIREVIFLWFVFLFVLMQLLYVIMESSVPAKQ